MEDGGGGDRSRGRRHPGERERICMPGDLLLVERVETRSVSRLTSARRESTVSGGVTVEEIYLLSCRRALRFLGSCRLWTRLVPCEREWAGVGGRVHERGRLLLPWHCHRANVASVGVAEWACSRPTPRSGEVAGVCVARGGRFAE